MKIIIVGNGKVGYAIASQLAGEHHDIVMVDDNAVALHRAENALDVMCIEGNGASIRVLKEAGRPKRGPGHRRNKPGRYEPFVLLYCQEAGRGPHHRPGGAARSTAGMRTC